MNAASRAFLSAGLMLWAVLPAFFGGHPVAATGANAAPVTMVEGTLLDLPTAFPDGSLRFHVAVGPLATDGGTIPVPVGGNRQTVPLFQDARLERGVPSDAVQVVVPQSVVDENAVWPGGKHVRVTGREGRFKTPKGPLRTVTIARIRDIVTGSQEQEETGETLFPTRLPNRRWVRFAAEGLDVPACGVIYRKGDTVTNGMPLGGIDTGATDLETSGMLGYTTIFNSHVPRRGPLNVPILGMSVAGRTWLLCDPQPKAGAGQHQRPLSDTRFDLKLDGLETVDEIHYWGHYPVADLEFETDAPVGVGLRAWAPFLPGALVDSMLPGTVFEVHLRNAGGHHGADAPHRFTHMYAKHYPSALEAAETLAANHESLLERILAWQEVLYAEQSLPVWLRDSLVNNLHLIAEDGMWAQKRAPLPDWVREADGLFGMNECPRGCPQIECIPCSFYGNQPLVYFFPTLALSTLRGYKGYQYPDGAAVWIFGGSTGQTPPIDFANPTKGYQWATNGISLAAMVDRYYLCHGDREPGFVAEFYPMIKSNMIYTVNLRPEYPIGDRIIAMPTGNEGTEWFEAPEPGWRGMTAHVGGLHLAQLRIAERMAKLAGDREFAEQCAEWITAGSESMEKKLWTGAYYLNYWEPETGSKSDLVFGYQLDGEWITDHHGLESALPADRVTTVLETVKRCNVAVTKYGAVNYTSPDGTPAQVKGYGTYSYFPPEALMLAMTYMYNGQREFGLELARKVWHNIVCLQGYTWDMPNIMRGDVDTGERTFGNDYYQDMMLWSLPAAMEGEDFGAPAKPGGLVDRVIQAARG